MSVNLPITLRLHELIDLPKAQPLLEDLVDVVRLFEMQFMQSSDEHPKVTSDDTRNALHLDDLTVRKIGTLLPNEQFVQQGGSWTETQWQFVIGRDVHFFKDIKTITDYLAVVERLRRPVAVNPAPIPELPQEPPEKPPIGFKPTQ